jgi:fumarate hydratase class II
VYQTGSGTSTNTNMNEVIAEPRVRTARRPPRHPNDDVNRCQSSNDAIPTAIQLAGALAIEEALLPALVRLQEALARKADEFWPVVKTGRTHLQDATPIRLGQEFRGYAGQVEEAIRRAKAAQQSCSSFRSAALPSGPASTPIRSTRHARPRGSASSWRWTSARRRTTSTRRRRSTR